MLCPDRGRRGGTRETRRHPRSLLHPGATAVHPGKAKHQRQADAGPGRMGRDGRPLPERLEDRLADLGRHPGSGILDHHQRPAARPWTRTHTGVPAGVCRAALASRFSTIRSTLGASTAISTGAVQADGTLAEQLRPCVLDDPADQLAKIDTLTVGVEVPLGERSRSSRLVSRRPSLRALPASRPSRSRTSPAELLVAAVQGRRDPQHRGERRTQVVGDGLQERVLHLVQLAEVLGGGLLPLQGVRQPLGGGLLPLQGGRQPLGCRLFPRQAVAKVSLGVPTLAHVPGDQQVPGRLPCRSDRADTVSSYPRPAMIASSREVSLEVEAPRAGEAAAHPGTSCASGCPTTWPTG